MKRLALVVLALAACDFPDPGAATDASAGGDAPAGDAPAGDRCGSDCRLLAISTNLANTGTTLTLEGRFSAPAIVHFPGGADVTATVLGPNRASVVVPAAATAGDLTVTTDGQTLGPLPFHRASYDLGLQAFRTNETQDSGARKRSALGVTHFAGAAIQIGTSVYVAGGRSDDFAVTSKVERARVNADGSLGAFTPESSLHTARDSFALVSVPGFIYAIAGDDSPTQFHDIERAAVDANGSLGPWQTLDTKNLVGQSGPAPVVIGDSLYVVGAGGVQRSIIGKDGSLGDFSPAQPLLSNRAGAGAFVAGGFLYVMGGADPDGVRFDSLERAPIAGDGSLGDFEAVTGVHLPTAVDIQNSYAVAGDQIIVVGGETSTGTINDVVAAQIHSDGSLGAFAKVGTLPEQRRLPAVTMVGDSLYLLGGGVDGVGLEADAWRASFHGGASPTTFDAAPSPALGSVVSQTGTAVIGDSLYVLTGTPDFSTTPTTIQRATIAPDGTLGAFTDTGNALVTGRRSGYVVVTGPFVYVLGGLTGANTAVTTVERASISPNGTLGAFATVPGLTVSHHSGAAAIVGDTLFLSAKSTGGILKSTIAADGSLGVFTPVNTPPAHEHLNPAVMVIDNAIYLLGGGDQTVSPQTQTPQVERAVIGADGSLPAWNDVGSLATAVSDEAAVVLGNTVFLIGGTKTSGTSFVSVATVQSSAIGDSGGVAFATVSGGTTARAGGRAIRLGEELWILGGLDGANHQVKTLLHATLH